MRLWIGPQLSLRDLDAKDKNQSIEVNSGAIQAVAGVNLHVTSSLSLTGELGYIISDSYHADGTSLPDNYDIDEDRSFFNVGILYRFGDTY